MKPLKDRGGVLQVHSHKLFITAIFFCAVVLSPSRAHAYYIYQPASIVIGQTDFSSNSSGVSQGKFANNTLRSPFVDPKGRLILSDQSNNRVLIWNTVPTKNGVSADLVLGQADFVSSSANRGGSRVANTLNAPMGIWSDGTKLIVVDDVNHRVLLWNIFPITNGQAADIVIGGRYPLN